jgi:2-dehydro-3-deoxygalactonokinase
MDQFLSCDWGTSSFRLRLVSIPHLNVIAEQRSGEGIATVYTSWKEKNSNEDRFDFYLPVLKGGVEVLQRKLNNSLSGIPIVISGMASSTIGMIDLPYKKLPVQLDSSDLVIKRIHSTEESPHDLFIISGLQTENDVLRGEETQLIGALDEERDGLFIFPGTHSKHIKVENGLIIDFKTYMTGEFFHLLSTKSILANSVEKVNSATNKLMYAFESGVEESKHNNLLHSGFLVRTNVLFNRYTKEENYCYLSGLVIGSELLEVGKNKQGRIYLVGTKELNEFYLKALKLLQPQADIKVIDAEEATIKGQYKIYKTHLNSPA